jgi:hypothetical protein
MPQVSGLADSFGKDQEQINDSQAHIDGAAAAAQFDHGTHVLGGAHPRRASAGTVSGW